MNTILRTKSFDRWLARLKDARAKARILHRIRTAERGYFGDCKSLGSGVSEMRIHEGPGYRVYFARIRAAVYVLLCGGTKNRQRRDVDQARDMAKQLRLDNSDG